MLGSFLYLFYISVLVVGYGVVLSLSFLAIRLYGTTYHVLFIDDE